MSDNLIFVLKKKRKGLKKKIDIIDPTYTIFVFSAITSDPKL